ncbi:MAG TPA: alanine--tRNA ligase [Verrucomicrobiae bacterium]
MPALDTRAADTQKCIRAGGKHNDLDDVGLDTYHHTFFEMLGNWSFGDYFKKEAIEWAWELVVEKWKFPPSRLYATVYSPDKSKNDPSEFDQEAWNYWAEKFRSVGLDPKVHIVNGNKKDNFWMMGETGPCGPCSELHVDLTPAGDTKGSLVNKGDARCIEIWNLVFIQFNANPDGTFSPLPAKHVDTGMGFERVTSIMQGTKGLKDFAHAKISNYETDIFRPIFDALEKLSGKKYTSTLPGSAAVSAASPQGEPLKSTGESPSPIIEVDHGTDMKRAVSGLSAAEKKEIISFLEAKSAEQIAIDIAFRVIADHIRTLSFAIADGIQPGNNDRNYVLRRILRRAVRYGRTLGFREPFFYKLVDVLADTMGEVFPEIRAKKKEVQATIQREEEAFNKTLDEGCEIFESALTELALIKKYLNAVPKELEKVRHRLDDLLESDTQRKDVEGIWAGFSLSIKDPEFAQEAIDSLVATPASSIRKAAITKLIIVEWWKEWRALWNPISDLFEGLEKLTDHKTAFAECRRKILNALTQLENELPLLASKLNIFPGQVAFKLYDTYGFPLDLTELMARERGLTVDKEVFDALMEEQKTRARAAQKKTVITVSEENLTREPTRFVGYERLCAEAVIAGIDIKEIPVGRGNPSDPDFVIKQSDGSVVIVECKFVLNETPFYAQMGGQVEDWGIIRAPHHGKSEDACFKVFDVQKKGDVFIHLARLVKGIVPNLGETVEVEVDANRRNAIQRHHTVTHLLHWALHEVVSKEASQKGSFVGPDKLTFDFNSAALTPEQIADIEKLVNERILENAGVSWTEVPYADIKGRKDVMQFFGEKYGDTVRVVQIGGHAQKLDGYSMELCGGTHTRATGEIGLFRIVGESAIAAGVRRIEAVAGLEAYRRATDEVSLIKTLAGKVNSPVHELDKKIEALLAHQKELEKQVKSAQQREASNAASRLLEEIQTVNGVPAIIHNLGGVDGDFLQAVTDSLKGRFKGVIVLGGGPSRDSVALVAAVTSEYTAKIQAGKIIQQIAPIVGGKGGGKPDNARGGGKDASKLDEALAKAKSLIG